MGCYDAFAPFYDRFVGAAVDYPGRAAYFDSILLPLVGRRGLLLDLACGTGGLSVELSRLGWEVIGVDGSEEMLSVAQQKALDAGENPLFLHQRMEALDLFGSVDACVCALDSLNHITDRRLLRRVFARVALFLSPGGVFAFDMNTPYKHRKLLGDNCYVFEDEGAVCVWQNQTQGLRTEITLDFFRRRCDGRYERSSERFCQRAYPSAAVRRLSESCDLRVLAVYGDDSLSPPRAKAGRYIFVTQKEG
jgi:SAM-dependent methyltransferase